MNKFADVENCRHRLYHVIRLPLLGLLLATAPIVLSGCQGTPLSLPQAFSGLGGAPRVPPPATGSYQVPQSYSGPNATSSGLGSSSVSPPAGTNAFKTSQNSQPISDLVQGVSAAQAQFRTATNSAINSVNRAANDVNARVENATARVDRFGEGVVQASAILSEAASAPSYNAINSDAIPTSSTSGRIGDATPTTESNTWRTPSTQP
jgi:hypothetical protein